MHTVKPKDDRPHLGIEFEHFMPGEMSTTGARKIYEEMPEKIRPMVDYFWEVLYYRSCTPQYGYEAKLCVPQDEYAPHLTTLVDFLRDKGAKIRPDDGVPRFGFHIHIDLRQKNISEVSIVQKLSKKLDHLLKYVDPLRAQMRYWGSEFLNRGFQTVEVRMMDSNFDLEKRIIPYINDIIAIKDAVEN